MNTAELLNQVHALRTKAARIEELARKHQEIEEELRDITGVDRVAVPFPMSFNKEEKPRPPRKTAPASMYTMAAKVDEAIISALADGTARHHNIILGHVKANVNFLLPSSGIRNRLCLLKKRGKIESCGTGFYKIPFFNRQEETA